MVGSAVTVAGFIWMVLGSMAILVFLGILVVLGFRRDAEDDYELIDPSEAPSEPIDERIAPPPLPPSAPDDREEPPDDWPPSLP